MKVKYKELQQDNKILKQSHMIGKNTPIIFIIHP